MHGFPFETLLVSTSTYKGTYQAVRSLTYSFIGTFANFSITIAEEITRRANDVRAEKFSSLD